MKRILVTGAAGFIGMHSSLALKKRGDAIIGLDNFNDYYPPALKRARAQLLHKEGIEVIEGDLCDRTLIARLLDEFECTHVLHLGAQAGVRYARENPYAYLKSNLEGFLTLLEALKGRSQIILTYASSSSVYGCNEKIPFAATDRTDSPANLYAATKKANELMAYSYNHLYGIRCTGLRYFTVYGPWGRPDMAYYAFTESILAGKPIHLFAGGTYKRDFTYIDDAVEGTLAALDCGANWEIFNIGNHKPEDLFTFVRLLEEALGRKAEVVLEAKSPGEVDTTFADIEHTTKMLGFLPKTPLQEGLKRFAAWHRSYLLNA